MADVLTKEQRSRNMKQIKASDTKIELKLRKALWNKGYRYRKNVKELPGKPDIVLTKQRIAIFCDSEFFHGKDWRNLRKKLRNSNNGEFWINKITRNIERDREVDCALRGMGYRVLRFWGEDIEKRTEACLRAVEETIFEDKILE